MFTKDEITQLQSRLHKGASTNSCVNLVVTQAGETFQTIGIITSISYVNHISSIALVACFFEK